MDIEEKLELILSLYLFRYHICPLALALLSFHFSILSSFLLYSTATMASPKPHAVCIPLPAQGHINPMLKLAKLLHFKGFHITFVHTEFNYHRLLNSKPSGFLNSLPDDFQFATIEDGLPPTNPRGILDLPALCKVIPVHGLRSFRSLIAKLSASSNLPDVTCIVSDGVMSFTLEAAQEFGIPEVLLFTPSGCGMLGYLYFEELKERGYFPLKGIKTFPENNLIVPLLGTN